MTESVLDLIPSCFKVSFHFLHVNFLFLLIRFLPLFYSHEHTSHASKLSGISTSRLSLVLLPFSCTGSVSVFKFECQSFFMEKELKWPHISPHSESFPGKHNQKQSTPDNFQIYNAKRHHVLLYPVMMMTADISVNSARAFTFINRTNPTLPSIYLPAL